MNSLSVSIAGRKVGQLLDIKPGKVGFQYALSWLESGFSLSPHHLKFNSEIQFPDISDARLFNGLFGVFSDSLPDGWGLLLMDRFFSKRGISRDRITAIDRLGYMGSRSMGALEYQPETDSSAIGAVNFAALANAVHEVLNGESTEILDQLRIDGGSPGGARPKVVVAFTEDMLRCYSGVGDAPSGYEHWLVKFRSKEDDVNLGAIEKSIADIAKLANIRMPVTQLINVGMERYFAVKRFDREGNRKIHMHTMAGFIHANFREPCLDYEDILGVVGFLTRNIREVEQMYKVAVFNVLTGNKDDHAKNFSLLFAESWKLAPAYDLTYSNGISGEHMTSMMGNGTPTKKEMISLARAYEIESFDEIIQNTRHAISEWANIATAHGIPLPVIKEYSKRFNLIDKSTLGK